MPETLIDLGSTKIRAGVAVRRTVLGPVGLLVALGSLTPLLLGYAATGDPAGVLGGAFLVLFALFIVRKYVRGVLLNDDLPLAADLPDAEALSAEMADLLPEQFGLKDLVNAAARSERGAFVITEMGLDPKDVAAKAVASLEAELSAADMLRDARASLEAWGESRIDGNIVLALVLRKSAACKEILNGADLAQEDVDRILRLEQRHHRLFSKVGVWSPAGLERSMGSIGRSWVSGYTNALDKLTSELHPNAHSLERSVVIHRNLVEQAMHVLSRANNHNILVLGKVGVGKRTFVENVALAVREAERRNQQSYSRVLVLRTQDLISGVADPDSFLLKALRAAESAGKCILVIKDLVQLLQSGKPAVKSVLTRFLEARNIYVFAIADNQSYHGVIKADATFDSLFEKIAVDDATPEETLDVLMVRAFALEKSHKVRITYKAIKSVSDLSRRYVPSGGFPGTAASVLDEAVLFARKAGSAFVKEEHVRDVVSVKAKMNIQKMGDTEKDKLIHLEENLTKKIVGQSDAIKALVSALKRARLDIREGKRPVGTFLFLGPTGVGKTQTAKVLAEEYFGAADAMIRLDMNEYSSEQSVFGIVGSSDPTAVASEGFLTKRVQDRPFSLILLDEIEKAHPHVLNLFLQILDEGHLIDARGTKTDFRNTIIIATSNAGALFIRDFVKQHGAEGKAQLKQSLLDSLIQQKTFTPEFLNRFDGVILYYPMDEESAKYLATMLIGQIAKDIQERRGITLAFDPQVVAMLAEKGHSIEFGAREMRRVITEDVENYLADYLLKHDAKRGDTITLTAADIQPAAAAAPLPAMPAAPLPAPPEPPLGDALIA